MKEFGWTQHEVQRAFIAPGSWAAIRTDDCLFAVGDTFPIPVECEISGIVLMTARVVKRKQHADGGWWFDLETLPGIPPRIPPADWNAAMAERRASASA